jgi:hypothetical protein
VDIATLHDQAGRCEETTRWVNEALRRSARVPEAKDPFVGGAGRAWGGVAACYERQQNMMGALEARGAQLAALGAAAPPEVWYAQAMSSLRLERWEDTLNNLQACASASGSVARDCAELGLRLSTSLGEVAAEDGLLAQLRRLDPALEATMRSELAERAWRRGDDAREEVLLRGVGESAPPEARARRSYLEAHRLARSGDAARSMKRAQEGDALVRRLNNEQKVRIADLAWRAQSAAVAARVWAACDPAPLVGGSAERVWERYAEQERLCVDAARVKQLPEGYGAAHAIPAALRGLERLLAGALLAASEDPVLTAALERTRLRWRLTLRQEAMKEHSAWTSRGEPGGPAAESLFGVSLGLGADGATPLVELGRSTGAWGSDEGPSEPDPRRDWTRRVVKELTARGDHPMALAIVQVTMPAAEGVPPLLSDAALLVALGDGAYRAGDSTLALHYWSLASQAAPDDPGARRALTLAALREGRCGDAQDQLRAVTPGATQPPELLMVQALSASCLAGALLPSMEIVLDSSAQAGLDSALTLRVQAFARAVWGEDAAGAIVQLQAQGTPEASALAEALRPLAAVQAEEARAREELARRVREVLDGYALCEDLTYLDYYMNKYEPLRGQESEAIQALDLWAIWEELEQAQARSGDYTVRADHEWIQENCNNTHTDGG